MDIPYHLVASIMFVIFIIPTKTNIEMISYILLGVLVDLDHIPWRLLANWNKVWGYITRGEFFPLMQDFYVNYHGPLWIPYPVWHGAFIGLVGTIIYFCFRDYRVGILVLVLHVAMDTYCSYKLIPLWLMGMGYGFLVGLLLLLVCGVYVI